MTCNDVVHTAQKLVLRRSAMPGLSTSMATRRSLALVVGTKLLAGFLTYEKEYAATVTWRPDRSATRRVKPTIINSTSYHRSEVSALSPNIGRGVNCKVPLFYSGVKHKGRRLFKIALKGEVERQPAG
jgi:tRNA U55 pseudouridine synthase TruB